MDTVLIVGTIKPGRSDEVRAIIEEGPPFSLWDSTIDRHNIYLGDNQIVFAFTGKTGMIDGVKTIAQNPKVLQQMLRLGHHLEGAPKQPELTYSWSREEEQKTRMQQTDGWETNAG